MAYMQNIHSYLHGNACVLLDLAVIMLAGFLLTRLTRRLHLPDVSGYILAGILIGPHVLGLVERAMVEQMNFVSDIALGFIAFGVGRFFERDTLRETGAAVILITLLESLVAGALVAVTLRWAFGLELRMSLMLGAIATATAPASTVMTIRQYNAQGEFVNKLLQIVALDDVVCLLAFSAVAAWVNTLEAHQLSMAGVVLDNTPNYILVVDDQMKICEMNPIALKAFNKRRSHRACQIRILAISLMSPAPSRIAENVDVRRPIG